MKSKVLVWDIEADDVRDAAFGTVLCIGYKWLGDKHVTVLSNLDKPGFGRRIDTDKYILQRFRKVYEQADYSIAHFGEFYDLPFVQTRLIINGLPTLPPTKIKDTWRIARKKLKFKSNRLDYIARALKVKSEKTVVDMHIWKRAQRGDQKAMRYIIDHCDKDVWVLEQVWEKLHPLASESLPLSSHSCSPKYLQSNGIRVCDKKRYRRLFCTKCGDWFKGAVI